MLKISSEGTRPWRYLTGPDVYFNAFDLSVVLISFALIGSNNNSTVSIVRLIRLVRLLTLIKGIPALRAIVVGLIQGDRAWGQGQG